MLTCVQRGFIADSSMYEVTRSDPGSYSALGRWESGVTSTLSVRGVAEPLKPDDILRLEDARHVAGAFKFYTLTELYNVSPANVSQPDMVTIGSRKYAVEGVSDWAVHGGGYKVIVVRREVQAHDS